MEQPPIHRFAPAKINLFLEIPAKRSDGYHEIATLMTAIDLGDELTFAPHDSQIELICDNPHLSSGPDNLIHRAARLLRSATGCGRGARITLKKRIPWAAGLGGGSSDAAATLLGLNDLWQLKLSREELAGFAAQLGSDVPFFLLGHAAWCTGRGEIVEPLPTCGELHFLLVKPTGGCATAEVYRRLELPGKPLDGTAVKDALKCGDIQGIASNMSNRLQESAFGINPDVALLFDCLKKTSCLGCLMSGSGSSLFALADGRSHASKLNEELDGLPTPVGTQRWITKSLP